MVTSHGYSSIDRHRASPDLAPPRDLTALISKLRDGVVIVSAAERIVSINAAGKELFGATKQAVFEGAALACWLPGLNVGIDSDAVHATSLQRSDGSLVPVDVSLGRLDDAAGALAFVVIRDCSAQRRLERELLELGDAIRRRVGRDLHDELGHRLTGIAFVAQGLAVEAPRELSPRLQRLATLASGALRYARSLSEALVAEVDDTAPLLPRLRSLAATTSATFDLDCELEVDDEAFELEPKLRRELLLLAQEALTNAARHARCRRVELRLEVTGPGRLFSVRDDGVGIPAGSLAVGLGIPSMERRARALGGRLELRARESGGTELRCRW